MLTNCCCCNSKDNMSSLYLTVEIGVSYGVVNSFIMIRVSLKKKRNPLVLLTICS